MSWKIIFVQVAWLQTKNCIKIRGSRTIHGIFTSLAAKQVCLGPMKSATCLLFPTARVASRVESYLTGYICFGYPCIPLNGDCAFSILWLSFYPWCTLVIVTNLPCYLKVSLVRGSRWKYAKKRRKRWVILQFCCFCSHQLILENENYWN